MKRKLFLLLVLGLLLILLLPGGTHAQGTANWTILYYSAADTDLESFMIGDLMEMQMVGSSREVNIVVQMDRVEGYDEVNGNWTDARRFLIEPPNGTLSSGDFKISREEFLAQLEGLDPGDFGMSQAEFERELDTIRDASDEEFEQLAQSFGAPLVDGSFALPLQTEAVDSAGEVESGSPEALADFAIWGIQEYPAENYMLIISNHGGGWTGVAFDESSDNDALSLKDLEKGLAEAVDATGIGKFDLVGFDACLMGQLEVYQAIAPYAEYTIASQEVIPGAGWEYVTPLEALRKNPDMSAADFGKAVIDSYMHYYTDVLQGYTAFDLHVIDLTKIDTLTTAVNNFSTAVQRNPDDNLRPIGKARANAQMFSVDDPDAAAYFSSVDLNDFMKYLVKITEDDAVIEAGQDVMAAIEEVVVYGAASDALPGSSGVAMYFPANTDDFEMGGNDVAYREQLPQALEPWQQFLDTFYGIAIQTFEPTDLTIDITEVIPSDYNASIWDPPVILFDTNGEGIVDLQFFAALKLDDATVIIDQSALEFTTYTADGEAITEFPEGQSSNYFTWNVEMPLLSDGENSELVVLLFSPNNSGTASISGTYHFSNGRTTEAYLVMDLETRTMQSVFSVEGSDSAIGQAIGELRPRLGDAFEPDYRTLNEDGTISASPSGTLLYFDPDNPLTYDFIPAPSGNYTFTMWVQDMAGNISIDSTDFAVDNEGLDADFRGFKNLEIGINFLFPWNWLDPSTFLNDDESYTILVAAPEYEGRVYIKAFDATTPQTATSAEDMRDIGEAYLEDVDAEFEDPDSIEIQGNEGYTFDYTYVSSQGDDRVGHVLVVYVESNGIGYLIDVDALEDLADFGDSIFETVTNTVVFFPPYSSQDTGTVVSTTDETLAFSDETLQLAFNYPADWSTPEIIADQSDYYAVGMLDPNNTSVLIVSAYPGMNSLEDTLELAENILSDYDAQYDPPEKVELTTLDDQVFDAYEFYYSYTDERGVNRYGGHVVVYNQETEVGYIIDVDAVEETIDIAEDAFVTVVNSLQFGAASNQNNNNSSNSNNSSSSGQTTVEDMTSYTDDKGGITYTYPTNWDPLEVIQDDEDAYVLGAVSPDGGVYFFVNVYNRHPNIRDLEETQLAAERQLNGVDASFSDPDEVTVETEDGQEFPAFEYNYSYTDNDGIDRTGYMLVLYNEETRVGYIIDIDGINEYADLVYELFYSVKQGFRFFRP